jgi:hypothetical protein
MRRSGRAGERRIYAAATASGGAFQPQPRRPLGAAAGAPGRRQGRSARPERRPEPADLGIPVPLPAEAGVPAAASPARHSSCDSEHGSGEAARPILPGSLHGDLAQWKSVVRTRTVSNRLRGKYDNLLDRPLLWRKIDRALCPPDSPDHRNDFGIPRAPQFSRFQFALATRGALVIFVRLGSPMNSVAYGRSPIST